MNRSGVTTHSQDVNLFIIEALQRLSAPLVFIHKAYAIAAISCNVVSLQKQRRGAPSVARKVSLEDKGFLFSSCNFADTTQDESVAQQLFNYVLRQWMDDSEEGGMRGYLSHERRRSSKGARVLMTSTVSLLSVVPFVTAVIRSFIRHHCYTDSDNSGSNNNNNTTRYHNHQSGNKVEALITNSIQGLLDFLLRWSYPSMGVCVSTSVEDSRLEVFTDVLYSSPLLFRPWMENAVLLALACAPEWALRDVCRSRRIAAWVYRYITAVKLDELIAGSRLERWNWLEKQLHSLMLEADMTLFTRTLCALLIALELELVVATTSDGSVAVVPRDKDRDGEGLLLLLSILREGRGDTLGKGYKKWRNKENTHYASCKRDNGGGGDDEQEDVQSCFAFDACCFASSAEGVVDAFLREHPTCVDFVAAATVARKKTKDGAGGCLGKGLKKNAMTAVRRLWSVADELYRFLSEWIRLAVNKTVSTMTAQLPLVDGKQGAGSRDGGFQLLPRLTIIVGRVHKAQCGLSHALPLSTLPVNLFGDVLLYEQLRVAMNYDCGDRSNVEPLNWDAANSLYGAIMLSVRAKKTQRQEAKKREFLFDIPIWSGGDGGKNGSNNARYACGSNGEDENGVLFGDTLPHALWLIDIIVNSAIRHTDESPTHWQKRVRTQMQSVVATTVASTQQPQSGKYKPFLSLHPFSVGDDSLFLLLRHTFTEARYALSPCCALPSLLGDVPKKGRGDGCPLLEFLDPTLQQRMGLLDGQPLWSAVEADYIDELRRGHSRLLWRAALALSGGGAKDAVVAVHIIPAPASFEQPSATELRGMRAAVDASLVSRLLPRTTNTDFQCHVKLPFSVFCERYGDVISNAHAGSRGRRDGVRRDLPPRASVHDPCSALKLSSTDFRLLNDTVELTLEGENLLARRSWHMTTMRGATVNKGKKAEKFDDDKTKNGASNKLRTVLFALPAPSGRCAGDNCDAIQLLQSPPQGGFGLFASSAPRSCSDVAPFTLEELCCMIDDALLPQ